MKLILFVDGDNIQAPSLLQEQGILAAALWGGLVERAVVAGNGNGLWKSAWQHYFRQWPQLRVDLLHVSSKPQAADAALIVEAALLEPREDLALILLSRDIALQATFARLCEIKGLRFLGGNEAKEDEATPLHRQKSGAKAGDVVMLWRQKHPKATLMPLNSIEAEAQRAGLTIEEIAAAAKAIFGKIDSKTRDILEAQAINQQ